MSTTWRRWCLALSCLGAVSASPAMAQGDGPPFGMPFAVTELRGEPVPEGVSQTLTLGEDGTVTGEAGCNTFSAGYATMKQAIMIQPARVTRMACPEDQMKSERRFFSLLMVAVSFEYDQETGTLALSGVSGPPLMRLKAANP